MKLPSAMVALYQLITGLMLASAIVAYPAKDARDGRLFFSATPAPVQQRNNQLVYLLPSQMNTESADSRWMWGHIKNKCRVCPDNVKPMVASFNPYAPRPWGWSMENSWNAWTRPWSTWGFLPVQLLPCCPKPQPKPIVTTSTTPAPSTVTQEPIGLVTIEFIENESTTTEPTDSQPTTTDSPPTPEVQTTLLPTTDNVQTSPLPTTEQVQDSTLPITESVQFDETTDDPTDDIFETGMTNDDSLLSDEPESAPTPASADLSAKTLDDSVPLIMPMLDSLTSTTANATDSMTSVQLDSANDELTDPTAAKVPALIAPLPVNSAISKPSKFTDSTEEDLIEGGLIPNAPLTKTSKTTEDTIRIIDLNDLLAELKQTSDDSLPPESMPMKGMRLLMNLYPPSYISFLRR